VAARAAPPRATRRHPGRHHLPGRAVRWVLRGDQGARASAFPRGEVALPPGACLPSAGSPVSPRRPFLPAALVPRRVVLDALRGHNRAVPAGPPLEAGSGPEHASRRYGHRGCTSGCRGEHREGWLPRHLTLSRSGLSNSCACGDPARAQGGREGWGGRGRRGPPGEAVSLLRCAKGGEGAGVRSHAPGAGCLPHETSSQI
jgi:hypothetical protein